METEEMDIEIHGIYIHNKSGNFYKVTHITKMKHPDNGNWIDCVIYEDIINYHTWVRSLDSFRNHFTLAM